MSAYIKKDAAIQFCDKVLGTDTVYSVEVKNAFKAYKAYLESLATVYTCSCVDCKYSTKKTTPVGTIRYECLFDHGWRDKNGGCENGREVGYATVCEDSVGLEKPKCGEHGEWLQYMPEYGDMWRCSRCHTYVRLPFRTNKMPYDFCPSCGADMREVQE